MAWADHTCLDNSKLYLGGLAWHLSAELKSCTRLSTKSVTNQIMYGFALHAALPVGIAKNNMPYMI